MDEPAVFDNRVRHPALSQGNRASALARHLESNGASGLVHLEGQAVLHRLIAGVAASQLPGAVHVAIGRAHLLQTQAKGGEQGKQPTRIFGGHRALLGYILSQHDVSVRRTATDYADDVDRGASSRLPVVRTDPDLRVDPRVALGVVYDVALFQREPAPGGDPIPAAFDALAALPGGGSADLPGDALRRAVRGVGERQCDNDLFPLLPWGLACVRVALDLLTQPAKGAADRGHGDQGRAVGHRKSRSGASPMYRLGRLVEEYGVHRGGFHRRCVLLPALELNPVAVLVHNAAAPVALVEYRVAAKQGPLTGRVQDIRRL